MLKAFFLSRVGIALEKRGVEKDVKAQWLKAESSGTSRTAAGTEGLVVAPEGLWDQLWGGAGGSAQRLKRIKEQTWYLCGQGKKQSPKT